MKWSVRVVTDFLRRNKYEFCFVSLGCLLCFYRSISLCHSDAAPAAINAIPVFPMIAKLVIIGHPV